MIYCWPADTTGCGEFRIAMAARALVAEGHEITLRSPGETPMHGRIRNGHLTSLSVPEDAEIVVVQRPAQRIMVEAITMIRQHGVHVVVDVDDDLNRIHPSNVAFGALHPKQNREMNWTHTAAACRAASLVTVSTPALAPIYGGHGRVAVVPNCIPERYLSIEHEDSDVIGWAGSVWSHPDDLQAVGNSLARIRPRFRHVGDPERVARNLGLDDDFHSTGVVPFDDYPAEVARIGIGISPLADSAFNKSKSWLRALQYAALGVPWVGSDLPEQRRLHALGCGVVVDRPREWERALRGLLGSSQARAEASAAGREVARGLTVEGSAWRWLDAWESARVHDRKAVRL